MPGAPEGKGFPPVPPFAPIPVATPQTPVSGASCHVDL